MNLNHLFAPPPQVSSAPVMSVCRTWWPCQLQCCGDECLQTPEPLVSASSSRVWQRGQRVPGSVSLLSEGWLIRHRSSPCCRSRTAGDKPSNGTVCIVKPLNWYPSVSAKQMSSVMFVVVASDCFRQRSRPLRRSWGGLKMICPDSWLMLSRCVVVCLCG